MQHLVSDLLKHLHESDQQDRRSLIKSQGTKKLVDAKDPIPFYVFKGATEERVRIVFFLVAHHALSEKDDYYYAAAIIVNVGSFENFVMAYRLIRQYREHGGDRPWRFHNSYFERQNWNMTRAQAEATVEQKIGVHPQTLDRFEQDTVRQDEAKK